MADLILVEYIPWAVLVPADKGSFVFMVRNGLLCPGVSAGGAAPKNGELKVEAPALNSAEPREPGRDAQYGWLA